MKQLRGLRFSLTEHIPAARWCLALAVIAFTAAVSVRKYIDLAETAAFYSFEGMVLIINDITKIVLIYKPRYHFNGFGIMFGEDFGGIDILRCGSRGRWLAGKAVTYGVNTALFFAAVAVVNLIVCSRTFEFSGVWSSGFVGFRVMTGSPAADFSAPPLPTIAGAALSAFLLYLFCGMINMFFSLLTGRESTALFVSLFAGIALGLLNMTAGSNGLGSQLLRCLVLAASSGATYVFSLAAVSKKNLGRGKAA